ncbi:hypothetical protein AVEN_171668-1 [Araneus ventricosus]|uniref:Uncharacterized protein n=1 Tax=Araneus ventricosus TaxID=182803 RepID=A0A4Y2A0S2_ARAVE|nr:hypothetical protein AVEN_171668-1 [Araneus ventricosus]
MLIKRFPDENITVEQVVEDTEATIVSKAVEVQNQLNLATFPPIEETARLHSWRVFLQVNLWTGHVIDPIKWGWKATKHRFVALSHQEPYKSHKNCLTALPANVPRDVGMLVVVVSKE